MTDREGMQMRILYVHGKGGTAQEAEHYRNLFPADEVIGLDYQTCSPWETGKEIRAAIEELREKSSHVQLIANSIGAFFSMNAEIDELIQKAYFISPIVDMEKLILDMMAWSGVTEEELKEKGTIHTEFGEDLSWHYLDYVRRHPLKWEVPTRVLYGQKDNLTSLETMQKFIDAHNAELTIMEDGEHWFHTEEQMLFLDEWIKNNS